MYGGAALAATPQDVADRSIQEALDAGINHFDVAASYGDAELRLGAWAGQLGPDAFLATKTAERHSDQAWAEINASLERLGVDQVDLIQLHSVGTLTELDIVTGRGGALEAAVRAQEQGLARAIGITGHGHGAPATHLEALRRYPFATVLTPWNQVLSRREQMGRDFAALVAEVRRQDVGLMTIKATARRPWPSGQGARYTTWYEPWDEQQLTDACVAFVLSEPAITSLAAPGDVSLLAGVITAAERAHSIENDVEQLLETADGYASPFLGLPE